MRRNKGQIAALFSELSSVLSKVRPSLSGIVICPLCIREFRAEEMKLLSAEHILSSKMGGTGFTLTCRRCNNTDGSKLDKHLVSAMKALDGIEGTEAISASWHSNKGHIAMNLLWQKTREKPVSLAVVERASNPYAVSAIPSQLFDGATLDFTLRFDCIPEQYWKAALRASYLTAFEIYGYEYVFSAGAAQVREVLNGRVVVPDGLVTEAFPDQEPASERIIMPTSLGGLGEFYIVLLKLASKRTRYITPSVPTLMRQFSQS